MNSKDKIRTDELTKHVWRSVCDEFLQKRHTDHTLRGEQIEPHNGRRDKAIRLLKKAGIITDYPEYLKEIYNIHRIKEAKEFAKPVLPDEDYYFQRELEYILGNRENAAKNNFWYNQLSELSAEEMFHVYFYKDEYTIKENLYVFRKKYEIIRQKKLLRLCVERELNVFYPFYLGLICGIKDTSEDCLNNEYHQSYARYMSFPMLKMNSLQKALKEYNDNLNFIEKQISDLEKVRSVVSEKGEDQVIKEIRQLIINNMKDENDPVTITEDRKSYTISCLIAKAFKNLFSYDILYDENTELFPFISSRFSYNNIFRSFNKEEDIGDEPKNESDAQEERQNRAA